jgi:hypothetical protein
MTETLSERMTFHEPESEPTVPQDFMAPEPLTPSADAVAVLDGPATGVIAAAPSVTESRVEVIRAAAFIESVKDGASATEAARLAGTTLAEIEHDPVIMAAVRHLVKEYSLDSATRKRTLRAKLNKILLEGDDKDALQAAKQIADDPEMGMGSGPTVAVQMNFNDTTRRVLDSVGEVPGVD